MNGRRGATNCGSGSAVSRAPVKAHKLRLALAAGEPAQEVVRFTHEHSIDLIVLAWNGVLELRRAAVAKAVIRAAACPILVLRVHADGEKG
jgi:nucleotide-binding universal stress UspA family protein